MKQDTDIKQLFCPYRCAFYPPEIRKKLLIDFLLSSDSSLSAGELNIRLIKQKVTISSVFFDDELKTWAIDNVCDICERVYGLPKGGIKMPIKKRDFVSARQCACYFLYQIGLTHSYIGRAIGRDHTTIMWSVRQFNDLYDVDRDFKKKAEEIEAEVLKILQEYGKKE